MEVFYSSGRRQAQGAAAWLMLPKASWRKKLEGGAVPHQLALLLADSGAEAAEAGQSPLEMSRVAPGGGLTRLQLRCDNGTDPH